MYLSIVGTAWFPEIYYLESKKHDRDSKYLLRILLSYMSPIYTFAKLPFSHLESALNCAHSCKMVGCKDILGSLDTFGDHGLNLI